MQKGKFNIIIGGMAGSEAKGKLAAYLADKHQPSLFVMAASPNAGHTYVDNGGKKWVTHHLPVGMLVCDSPAVLGPTSVINLELLEKEMERLGIGPNRVFVDPRATIIQTQYLVDEAQQGLSDIGSTLQGILPARAGKMARNGSVELWGDKVGRPASTLHASGMINNFLDNGRTVQCEMTQGFDLCLEHGIHPRYATSKMIHPAMAMAEAGVSPVHIGFIYGVIRPYPIRVNNRTGTSGPYPGAREITWGEVAANCGYDGDVAKDFAEITTTTKLLRRVFTFSWERFNRFLDCCRPSDLCLQFANYVDWDDYGVTGGRGYLSAKTRAFIKELDKVGALYGTRVRYVGTGPKHSEMVEV